MQFHRTGADAAAISPKRAALVSPTLVKLACVAGAALLTANCGSQQRVAGGGGIDPKYGVAPSPRVVAEGEPVPKGGGRDQIGQPYRVAGRTYVPREDRNYSREGLASWYGSAFHGRRTANGEVFDRHSVSAAHPTMPLPSYARITNVSNGRSMIVRVNDRGPYHANRLIDVSQSVADALSFRQVGTARVRVDYVGRASLAGSDDRILMASLRTDGRPATMPGTTQPVMVASAEPETRTLPVLRQAPQAPALVASPTVVPTRLAMAPVETRAEPPRIVSNVPMPPERPYDLGRAAAAAGPALRLSNARADRPTVAGLFFAPAGHDTASFRRDDPFAGLAPQRFVSLRTER
ncbi:septal ring lytic transglycosylase RlpA family protein [Salinarimonas soli]|uniref:Endolytic peptidoglycan transglycosylase RlpA n=2 Tax=Salinarimonas soli TaxID=1638099 RepID=A0A5B2VSJ0_9HYPH|nr:septal ring lytic transglycosylase RlpA family protein [Salinarimonas soli]